MFEVPGHTGVVPLGATGVAGAAGRTTIVMALLVAFTGEAQTALEVISTVT